MPVFNFPFWDHSLLGKVSCFEVEAAMLFPGDAQSREQYVMDQVIKWYMDEEDSGTRSAIRDCVLFAMDDQVGLQRLLGHETATRRLDQGVKKAYDCGCVAGQIAAILWHLQEYYDIAPDGTMITFKPSLRKATAAICATYQKWPGRTRNMDYIRKAWRSHKQVSHLWARLVLFNSQQDLVEFNDQGQPVEGDPEASFDFFLRPHLPAFLALAEEIRHQILPDEKGPWTIPAHIDPPTDLIRDVLPLSGNLAEAVVHYKADPPRR